MNDAEEISRLLRPLARVEPGRKGSGGSGAGAQALLASITGRRADAPAVPGPDTVVTRPEAVAAGSPGAPLTGPLAGRRHRSLRPGPRRLALGLTAAALLATGVVVGPSLVRDGGGVAVSYANAAVDIRRDGDQYVARIKDPFAEYALYTEAFRAVGLRVELRPVPVSPGYEGTMLGMAVGGKEAPDRQATPDPSGPRFGGVPLTLGTDPRGCEPGRSAGCVMVIRVPAGLTGRVDVRIGRQARPGEEYANFDAALAPGGMFHGVRLRDGRPVGEILAEARKRELSAVFSLIRIDPKTGGLSFEPLPADRVGGGWTVWNAWQVKAGVVRLLVTPGRLPENPFYNGSAPPPALG
ncbi:hypothetical protein ACWEN6_33925 [Sphaerisporangium sp. NPDC004334]